MFICTVYAYLFMYVYFTYVIVDVNTELILFYSLVVVIESID